MTLFDLSKELVILILEELDPWTLLQFCNASQWIHLIAFNCTALRYKYELALCGLKDGPRSLQLPRARLEQLLNHKRGWPTLSWSLEDILRIAPPTIIGVSGGFLFHASESSLNNGHFQWTLQLYELRSFRKVAAPLRHLKYNVPFDIRRVAIDPSQNLMVLADLYHPSNNSVITARLHFLDLWTFQQHRQAAQLRYTFHTDWWGVLPPGQRIWIQQVEICGNKVGLGVRLEIEEGEGTTELMIVNWRTGRPRRYSGDLLSFQFMSEIRLLVASHPDDDDDDDDDDEESESEEPTMTWEHREDGIYMTERGQRTPQITLHDISDDIEPPFPRIRIYELPESWSAVSCMQICPNASPRSEAEVTPGTFFYSDPSQRIVVVSVQLDAKAIPAGCSRNFMLIFDESLPCPPGRGEEIIVRWPEWRNRCLVRNLPDGAHSLQVVGRRLMFFDNIAAPTATGPSNTRDDPRSRLRMLDFNSYAPNYLQSLKSSPAPWTWGGSWTTITAVVPHRVLPYIRTSTVDGYDLTCINVTEDGLVLYDEYEEETIVKILTFGKDPRLRGRNLAA